MPAFTSTSISGVNTADLVKWPGLLVKNLTHVALPSATIGSIEDFAGADKLEHFSASGATALKGTHHVT